MTAPAIYLPFVEQRQQCIDATNDPSLRQHYQAEINLVNSWGAVGSGYPVLTSKPVVMHERPAPVIHALQEPTPKSAEVSPNDFTIVPHGYATDWHAIRFSNTTNEPITVHVTVAAGEPLPKGVDASGNVTIRPGRPSI